MEILRQQGNRLLSPTLKTLAQFRAPGIKLPPGILGIDPRDQRGGEKPTGLLQRNLTMPLEENLQIGGSFLAGNRMKDLLGMGGNNGRVGIHQITQIREHALALDHQLLLHKTHRLRIIIPKQSGQGVALGGHGRKDET